MEFSQNDFIQFKFATPITKYGNKRNKMVPILGIRNSNFKNAGEINLIKKLASFFYYYFKSGFKRLQRMENTILVVNNFFSLLTQIQSIDNNKY